MNAKRMSVEYCFVKQNSCFQVRKIWKALLGTLGKKISEKSPHSMFKTRLDSFGKDFWHFWNFETFLVFFENYRRLDHPWNTGRTFFFRKNCPKTCSKQVWTILWTILCLFGFLKFFEDSNFHGTLGKIFFRKKCPKTRLDTWERFWTALEVWNLLDFSLEFFLSIYLEF